MTAAPSIAYVDTASVGSFIALASQSLGVGQDALTVSERDLQYTYELQTSDRASNISSPAIVEIPQRAYDGAAGQNDALTTQRPKLETGQNLVANALICVQGVSAIVELPQDYAQDRDVIRSIARSNLILQMGSQTRYRLDFETFTSYEAAPIVSGVDDGEGVVWRGGILPQRTPRRIVPIVFGRAQRLDVMHQIPRITDWPDEIIIRLRLHALYAEVVGG